MMVCMPCKNECIFGLISHFVSVCIVMIGRVLLGQTIGLYKTFMPLHVADHCSDLPLGHCENSLVKIYMTMFKS